MNAAWTSTKRHQSRIAAAVSSGPLSTWETGEIANLIGISTRTCRDGGGLSNLTNSLWTRGGIDDTEWLLPRPDIYVVLPATASTASYCDPISGMPRQSRPSPQTGDFGAPSGSDYFNA